MNKKQDLRISLTKTMLKNAFMKLLHTKTIKDITVKELCDEANINRTTFYSHYSDIYDLLDQIEKELYDDLEAILTIENLSDMEYINSIFPNIMNFFVRNADLCSILLGKRIDNLFIQEALDMGKEKFAGIYMKVIPGLDAKMVDYVYAAIANGFIGMIGIWYERGQMESISEMEKIIGKIVSSTMSSLMG